MLTDQVGTRGNQVTQRLNTPEQRGGVGFRFDLCDVVVDILEDKTSVDSQAMWLCQVAPPLPTGKLVCSKG